MMQSNNIPMQDVNLWNVGMPLECNDLLMICPIIRVSEETFDGDIVLIVMHLSNPINDWSG